MRHAVSSASTSLPEERESEPGKRAGAPFTLVASLFLISGATGLLYEVAFSKLLAYVFGATAYAVSTVLASFMGGLALGAHFGGKNAARATRPLQVYGALEMIVGAMCALSPVALGALTDLYVAAARSAPSSLAWLTVFRAGLTALVVVVPTVAMGATLPLLSRVVAGTLEGGRVDEAGKRLSRLYAINTAGGAMGALLSAYAILPWLGVRGTMRAAALANLAIGAVAFFAGRTGSPIAPVEEAAEKSSARVETNEETLERRLLLGLALASGFLVFAAEVIQTHLLALLIGNSAYAFGLMLAVFLVCLAIGAARVPSFSRKHGEAALARGLVLSALALAVTLPLWAELPRLFTFAGRFVSSWGGREAVRALAALAILAPPTLFMGTTFPLLLNRVASRADVAARVGRLTVANTIGTILGSIVTGYALLPLLGSERGLVFVAGSFAAAALLAARGPKLSARARRNTAIAGGVALALAVLLPKWDMARLTSGANVYFVTGPRPDAIDFVREDVHGGVTTVARRGDVRTLYTNGKFQGDDGAEMAAQRRFAAFPSLFVRHEGRALVVGLGTGVTLGTIASWPYAHIDAAEISPSIVEAARTFYAGPSYHSLEDPRVTLHVTDGRNLLLVSTQPYDLITMELSSVWFAGASSLYSKEFYELCKARLADDGILQQWVQLHHIRRRELGAIFRSLRQVFPHVALFVGGGQGILVASRHELVASKEHLAELERRPEIQRALDGRKMADLFDELVFSEADFDHYVDESDGADEGLVSTDDNLYLEYATPKGNVMNYDASLTSAIDELRRYATPDPRARHLR